jgi:thioesterase domain-containing protein
VDPASLERYLHDHIPLSAAMEVSVLQAAEDCVVLSAPLAPNINHRDTVFGGSASALAILAAWSLVHVRLAPASYRIVIQRNQIDYTAPMLGEFTASASLVEAASWDRFLRLLERRGRARIRVGVALRSGGVEAARLEGDFVAIDVDGSVPGS